jgi:hypothetical protein
MKVLISLFYRKKTHGGRMKSIKYLLTAISMVSTGLSAMEPVQNNALVPAKVQAVRDAGSMEADLLGKIQIDTVADKEPVIVQLPPHIAQKIAAYTDLEAAKEERRQKRLKFEKTNQRIKQDTAPIRVGLGIASGLVAMETLSVVSQYGLSNLDILKSSIVVSALFGLMFPSLIYSIDYGNYKQNQAEIRDPYSPYSAPMPYKRAFKWKSGVVRNYPDLYLKHSFDIATNGFKYAFGATFAVAGLAYATLD